MVGLFFLVVGALGFVPQVTVHHEALRLVGYGSSARLFGVFQISVLLNLVHLLFGLAGLAMSRTIVGARTFLVGGGALYLVVSLFGAPVGQPGARDLLPVNAAAGWLHLGLGALMVAAGAVTPRGRVPAD